jgi:Spy/CpxP family protein refolding chaperone
MLFKKYMVSLGLISCIALPMVLAQPSAMHQGTKQDALGIYKEAGITPVQEAKIRQMAKDFDSSNSVKLHRLMNLLQEMRTLSLTPDLDEKAALAKQDEINKLQSDSSNDRVKLLVKIRSLLTPEQRKKLVQLMQKSLDSQPPLGAKG